MPVVLEVRIKKGESRVVCKRDALAGRRNRCLHRAGGHIYRRSERKQGIEINGPFHRIRQPFYMRVDFRMFAGLHQAQMPFRQDE
ncbi:hypothetical protein D3C87_1864030 [compost metagenome]